MSAWFDLPDFEGYGEQWSPLNEAVAPEPVRRIAELSDADRSPLGATWTLPPDYTLWQKMKNWKARWFA